MPESAKAGFGTVTTFSQYCRVASGAHSFGFRGLTSESTETACERDKPVRIP